MYLCCFFVFCKCDGWYFMSINYNAARLIERGLRKHHTAVTFGAGVTAVSVNTPCEASQRSSESETRREWHELLSSSLPRTSSGSLLFFLLSELLHFAARELRVSSRRNRRGARAELALPLASLFKHLLFKHLSQPPLESMKYFLPRGESTGAFGCSFGRLGRRLGIAAKSLVASGSAIWVCTILKSAWKLAAVTSINTFPSPRRSNTIGVHGMMPQLISISSQPGSILDVRGAR